MMLGSSQLTEPDRRARVSALASHGAACRAAIGACLSFADATGFKDTYRAFADAAVRLDQLSRLTDSLASSPAAMQSAVFSRLLRTCACASDEVAHLAGAHAGDRFLACCVVCRDYQRACSKLAITVRR